MALHPTLSLAALALLLVVAGPAAAAGDETRVAPPVSAAPTLLTDPPPEPGAAGRVTAAPAATWDWPLTPRPRVVTRFHAPAGPYAAGHRGVDLAAHVGQPVVAPQAGVVSFAGVVAGRDVVVVTHADGLRSTLEPVTASVARGSPVGRGGVVGVVAVGPGHCLAATCVHWGVLRGSSYLDPLTLVGADGHVILLPLPG